MTKVNACPICNNARRDCGTQNNLSDTIYYCKGATETPRGYRHIGIAASSFPMYVVDNGLNYTSNSYIKTSVAPDVIDVSKIQDCASRHQEITKLVTTAALGDAHKKSLLKRGFTQQQIKELRFVSLIKGRVYNVNFTGLRTRQYQGADGLVIPIKNIHEQYIGFQIGTNYKDAKYQWTTDRAVDTTATCGASQHLVFDNTKELPVQVVKGIGNDIWFCEGILKPLRANTIHNKNIIGAAGGHFTRKVFRDNEYHIELQQQVLDALAVFGNKVCKIQLDTGSLLNEHVVKMLLKLGQALVDSGYDPVYGDWGQWYLDKTKACDIDEITNDTEIEYRSLEYFTNAVDNIVYSNSKFVRFLSNIACNTPDTNTIDATKLIDKYNPYAVSIANYSGITTQKEYEFKVPCDAHTEYRFDSKIRSKVIVDACIINNGKYILDTSETGSGKTTAVNELQANACMLHADNDNTKAKLLYLCLSPEKQEESLPNFTRIQPRTRDNCKKSLSVRAKQMALVETPNCAGCPFFNDCKNTPGQYIYEKVNALKADRIICHPLALVGVELPRNTVVVADEVEALLALVSTVEISTMHLNAMSTVLDHIGYNDDIKDIRNTALDVINALRTILTIKKPHGYDTDTIREKLSRFNLQSVDFTALNNAIYDINTDALQEIKFKRERESINLSLILNFFPVIQRLFSPNVADRAVATCIDGSTEVTTVIKVEYRNLDVLETLKRATKFIGYDATATPIEFARLLGVDSDSIVNIKAHNIGSKKADIVIYTDLGNNPRNRTPEQNAYVQDVINSNIEVHGEGLGIATSKALRNPDREASEVTLGGDARGSNKLQNKHTLLVTSTYIANLNAQKARFELLYNKSASIAPVEFRHYTEKQCLNDVIQTMGRLRQNRDDINQKTMIHIGNINGSYLASLGHRVTYTTYKPNPKTNMRIAILNAAMELIRTGEKVTNKALVGITGITKQVINRFYTAFGGIQRFTTVISKLCAAKVVDQDNVSPDLLFEARVYLAGLTRESSINEVITALLERIDVFGDEFLDYCTGDVLSVLLRATLRAT